MGYYHWEAGKIVIPAADWLAFRQRLVQAYNSNREQCYRYTDSIHLQRQATIRFDDAQRTVSWLVYAAADHNAVEAVWRHPIAQAFGQALKQIEWTNGSGGFFIGNDNDNLRLYHVGGGSPYVTKMYGRSSPPTQEEIWEMQELGPNQGWDYTILALKREIHICARECHCDDECYTALRSPGELKSMLRSLRRAACRLGWEWPTEEQSDK